MGYSVINPWPGIIPPLQDPHVMAMAARKHRTPSQARGGYLDVHAKHMRAATSCGSSL